MKNYFKDWLKVLSVTTIIDIIKTDQTNKKFFQSFNICDYDKTKVIIIHSNNIKCSNLLFIEEDQKELQSLKDCFINFGYLDRNSTFVLSIEDIMKQGILYINTTFSNKRVNRMQSNYLITNLINHFNTQPGLIFVLIGKEANIYKNLIKTSFHDIILVDDITNIYKNQKKIIDYCILVKNKLINKYGDCINLLKQNNYE